MPPSQQTLDDLLTFFYLEIHPRLSDWRWILALDLGILGSHCQEGDRQKCTFECMAKRL